MGGRGKSVTTLERKCRWTNSPQINVPRLRFFSLFPSLPSLNEKVVFILFYGRVFAALNSLWFPLDNFTISLHYDESTSLQVFADFPCLNFPITQNHEAGKRANCEIAQSFCFVLRFIFPLVKAFPENWPFYADTTFFSLSFFVFFFSLWVWRDRKTCRL